MVSRSACAFPLHQLPVYQNLLLLLRADGVSFSGRSESLKQEEHTGRVNSQVGWIQENNVFSVPSQTEAVSRRAEEALFPFHLGSPSSSRSFLFQICPPVFSHCLLQAKTEIWKRKNACWVLERKRLEWKTLHVSCPMAGKKL